MPKDHRNHYRVGPGPELQLRVTVRSSSGESWRGEVLDASFGGIRARFPRNHAPRLPIGGGLQLALHISDDEPALDISAKLVHWHNTEEGPSYGFQIFDLDLDSKLGRRLVRLFNRREAFRVTPDPKQVPAIKLYSPDDPQHSAMARMRDIAVLGLGITLDERTERFLYSLEVFCTEFELPPRPTVVKVTAEAVDRRQRDGEIVYGLRFLPELTPQFEKQQRAIGEYVALRQREQLHEDSPLRL